MKFPSSLNFYRLLSKPPKIEPSILKKLSFCVNFETMKTVFDALHYQLVEQKLTKVFISSYLATNMSHTLQVNLKTARTYPGLMRKIEVSPRWYGMVPHRISHSIVNIWSGIPTAVLGYRYLLSIPPPPTPRPASRVCKSHQ